MKSVKLALCALLALSLAGCGGGEKDNKKDAKPADSSKVTPKDAGTTKDDAAKAAADMAAAAKAKYDEVVTALKAGKLDVAEAGVKSLNDMKGKLSKEWQDKITALVEQLDAAKKAPSLPKLPDTPAVPALPK